MRSLKSTFHILLIFLRLGITSFGGPIAHLGYFENEFVTHRKWLDAQAFADLVDRTTLLKSAPVERVEMVANGFVLDIGGINPARVSCTRLFNAAGMGAQSLIHGLDGFDRKLIPSLVAVKGNYFTLSGNAPFAHLIYPPPVLGSSGRHYSCDFGGQAHIGPDTEWLGKVDYTGKEPIYWWFKNPDTPNEGFIQVGDRQTWKTKINYAVDPARKPAFVESFQSYYPDLNPEKLRPTRSGIRPKIGVTSQDNSDFMIMDESVHGIPGLVCLFGIESPGLTGSPWIAQRAAVCLDGDLLHDPRQRMSVQELFYPEFGM